MRMEYETALLDRILEPVSDCLTPEAAGRLVGLRADPMAQQRMDELADKSTSGELSPDEQMEYEAYISAANLLAILQAKAQKLLVKNG